MYLEIRSNFSNSHLCNENVIYRNPDLYQYWGYLRGNNIFYFSGFLIKMWNKYWPDSLTFHRKERKIFTKANRKFVRIKVKYDLLGIVILSPVLLSIPIGSFLAVKYYGTKPQVISRLIAGQFCWSVVYTVFYTQVKTILVWLMYSCDV